MFIGRRSCVGVIFGWWSVCYWCTVFEKLSSYVELCVSSCSYCARFSYMVGGQSKKVWSVI